MAICNPEHCPVLIINPHAGDGYVEKNFKKFSDILTEKLGAFNHFFPETSQEATEKTRAAIKKGSTKIIAVGGDGTINSVVNGFFKKKGSLINPHAVLGIIPLGTGNDFCRSIGLSEDWIQSLDTLKNNNISMVDVGCVECEGEHERTRKYFINIASFGLSSEVIRRVDKNSSPFFSKLKYQTTSVSTNLFYSNKHISIACDQQPAATREMRIGVVANGRFFGGNIQIAPHSSLSDGLFDLHIFEQISISDLFANAGRLVRGEPASLTPSYSERTKHVEINTSRDEEKIFVEADGEIVGQLPATFAIGSQIPVLTNLRIDYAPSF